MSFSSKPAAVDIQAFLEAHDIRPTISRLAVMAILAATEQPMSVDSIHRTARAAGHRCSQASVYRALAGFAQAGIAVQGWAGIDPAHMVYSRAPATRPPIALRLSCRACGRIIVIDDKILVQQLYLEALRLGFDKKLDAIEIGIDCSRCHIHSPA